MTVASVQTLSKGAMYDKHSMWLCLSQCGRDREGKKERGGGGARFPVKQAPKTAV